MIKNFKDVKVGDKGKDILGLEGKVIAKGMLGWLMDVDATATRIEGNTEDIDADAVAVEMLDSGEVYICVYGQDGFLVDDSLLESKKIEKSPYREQNLNELKCIIESNDNELGGFRLGKINDVLNGLTYDYNNVYENDDGHLVIVIEDPEKGQVDISANVNVEVKALMDDRVIVCAYIEDDKDDVYVENAFPTFTSDSVNTTIEDFIQEYEDKMQSGSLTENKKFKESVQDDSFFEQLVDILEDIDFCYKDIYESNSGKITIELDDIDDISGVVLEIVPPREQKYYSIICHVKGDESHFLGTSNLVLEITSDKINEAVYNFLKEYEQKEVLTESQKLQENVQSGDIFIIQGVGGDADFVNDVAKEMQSPMCMVDGKKAFKMTIEQVEELLGECDPGCFNMWECPSDIREESFDSDTLVKIYDIESAVWDRD